MIEHANKAATLLAQASVDIIGFLCTAGSFINGIGFDRELSLKLKSCTGIKTVTTATAVLDALNYLKAKKLVVLTPYSAEINELERIFLEGNGIKVHTIK